MSKIEQALNKARGLRLLGSGGAKSQALMAAPVQDPGQIDLVRSSQQIAHMAEPIRLGEGDLQRLRIISQEMEDVRVANAFRELRTRVLERSGGRNCVTLVTSIASGHGSSFVALNLAAAFSYAEGKTALLMDCNLSDPAFNDLAFPDERPGLVDFFESADTRVEEMIHPTGIHKLRVIPTGGKSEATAEYFTSIKMRQLLQSIKQRYSDRYVIVDAPPVLESADSRIVAQHCDFVLLVVPYGKVVEAQIQAAVKAIGEQKLIGVVFNDQPQFTGAAWESVKKNLFAVLRSFRRFGKTVRRGASA